MLGHIFVVVLLLLLHAPSCSVADRMKQAAYEKTIDPATDPGWEEVRQALAKSKDAQDSMKYMTGSADKVARKSASPTIDGFGDNGVAAGRQPVLHDEL